MLRAYYDYHDWAMGRLLRLCDGLTDEQLDAPREMGMGSLRATLFHLLAAERHWMKRWKGLPEEKFPLDPQGISLVALAVEFAEAAKERAELMADEAKIGYQRIVHYVHPVGGPNAQAIGDLLLHVCNHAIHHRAQAINMLKGFGRTIPGGLDFLFYKIAHPSTPQTPEAITLLKTYGLEVDGSPSGQVPFEKQRVQNYFAYTDWAVSEIMKAARTMGEEKLDVWLDRSFEMGLGSPRKTFLHLLDAESWWLRNWTIGTSAFDKQPETTPLDTFERLWRENAVKRNEFVAKQDAQSAQRVVTVKPGGPPLDFRVAESFLQLCCHGTHHRAQLLNMLRHGGAELPKLDYSHWLRVHFG